MSASRLLIVARDEFHLTLRRPMVWTLIVLLFLLSWGLSEGVVGVAIGSGDASVGGKRVFLTSQFAITQVMAVFVFMFYTFFVSAAAGLSVIRDDESRVLEVLMSTPLRPVEYAWGKFAGVTAAFLVVLVLHIACLVVFLSLVPNADMIEARGPFALSNYLVPALVIAVPSIVFAAGVAFGVGTGTRRAILVFVVPIAMLMLGAFLLWNWSPSWLPESTNRLLMFLDPAAVRWLNETYLEVDRGATYYNSQPVGWDTLIVANRLFWSGLAVVAAWSGIRRFTATARTSHRVTAQQVQAALAAPAAPAAPPPASTRLLSTLQMVREPLGAVATAFGGARAEGRELASRAGLYLFVPLIVVTIVNGASVALGAFDTPLLLTPGQLASSQAQLMAVYVSLLLVFYGVESMERERATRLNAIQDTLPVRTGALLLGKLLALGIVWLVVAVASMMGAAVLILVQGRVPFSLTPFAILWGLLFLPTFLAFSCFCVAVWCVTRNRYTTYALALGALGLTLWADLTDRITWLSNWALWSGIKWTDIGPLEFDRQAIVLNRLLWLSVAVAFWRLAVATYPRTARDPLAVLRVFSWRGLARALRGAAPWLVAPALLAALTFRAVQLGPDGAVAEKAGKDYWKKNLATWREAYFPWLKAADVDIEIEPAARRFRVKGSYLVMNHRDTTLRSLAMTVGRWTNARWTIDGDSVRPDTSTRLYVFRLARPLAPHDSVRIGFSYNGDVSAPSKGSGGAPEFIVPSAVVMTAFGPSWFPMLGYVPDLGTDEDNTFEPRQYPEDWYVGTTRSLFGSQLPMTVRTRITVPAGWVANGVGELVSSTVIDGRRTATWITETPVMSFNVVAGALLERRGEGTALYYNAQHPYNIDEMMLALNSARRWYGEWFGTFPWKLLKVTEFPNLAGYAQGFPTNITFSEGIGFLTKNDARTNPAFMVTAHEIAHQWWGNMLQPGYGPGANLLSEGMSHFSTMLLVEQVKGFRGGLELRKGLESRWADGRRADAERKLYLVDGSKAGDGVVTYEKAGWTFWMLAERMGRDNATRGMKEFIAKFRGSEDHAALQDLTAHLRAYTPDTAAYDDFLRQWFDTVSVLEYQVPRATTRRAAAGGDWETTALIRNVGNARMPIDIAVTRGERYANDTTGTPAPGYQQAITRVTVGARDSLSVTLRSPFEPEKVVVDPDVRLLMLRRKLAEAKVTKG
ncbi:MAG: ABC transporter permease [Gemmatimonadaceae bacterium]|nr:ABC transporter permease [Gemmatimonadaceae bacterium]